ncbi:hypothetical protein DFH08DRAFT_1047573 [Mycena albidolilacea]|uniref:Uncharacterized protein n=1 Tax=Mycena albidolilacea TaxID=1033008 RepID=A0AAD7AEM6_9AGAR|nr:hypothetical protein DFH08DRAFT_1047573 [Mycena albidolilacea]
MMVTEIEAGLSPLKASDDPLRVEKDETEVKRRVCPSAGPAARGAAVGNVEQSVAGIQAGVAAGEAEGAIRANAYACRTLTPHCRAEGAALVVLAAAIVFTGVEALDVSGCGNGVAGSGATATRLAMNRALGEGAHAGRVVVVLGWHRGSVVAPQREATAARVKKERDSCVLNWICVGWMWNEWLLFRIAVAFYMFSREDSLALATAKLSPGLLLPGSQQYSRASKVGCRGAKIIKNGRGHIASRRWPLPESLTYMIGDRGDSVRRIRMAEVDYRRDDDAGELRRIQYDNPASQFQPGRLKLNAFLAQDGTTTCVPINEVAVVARQVPVEFGVVFVKYCEWFLLRLKPEGRPPKTQSLVTRERPRAAQI